MCRLTTCPECQKTTWAGCGRHVDQVMAAVPAAQRCHHKPTTTAEAKAQAKTQGGGFFSKLFGGGPRT